MTASKKITLSKAAQQRIARYAGQLATISKKSAKARNVQIRKASKGMVEALADCARALIKGLVSLDRRQLNAIRRREREFRSLIDYKTNVGRKKTILQSGGFLPALFGPLLKIGLPIVTNLLGGLLGGRSK